MQSLIKATRTGWGIVRLCLATQSSSIHLVCRKTTPSSFCIEEASKRTLKQSSPADANDLFRPKHPKRCLEQSMLVSSFVSFSRCPVPRTTQPAHHPRNPCPQNRSQSQFIRSCVVRYRCFFKPDQSRKARVIVCPCRARRPT
jgi:hypothetical protein